MITTNAIGLVPPSAVRRYYMNRDRERVEEEWRTRATIGGYLQLLIGSVLKENLGHKRND